MNPLNPLETRIVEYAAGYFINSQYLDEIEKEIDSEFTFAIKTAKDWGEISGLPDTVMDICIRASGIDWCISKGPTVRNRVDGAISLGKLVCEALGASNRYSVGDVGERKVIKRELQTIYLTLGDYISQEWAKRNRR